MQIQCQFSKGLYKINEMFSFAKMSRLLSSVLFLMATGSLASFYNILMNKLHYFIPIFLLKREKVDARFDILSRLLLTYSAIIQNGLAQKILHFCFNFCFDITLIITFYSCSSWTTLVYLWSAIWKHVLRIQQISRMECKQDWKFVPFDQ